MEMCSERARAGGRGRGVLMGEGDSEWSRLGFVFFFATVFSALLREGEGYRMLL